MIRRDGVGHVVSRRPGIVLALATLVVGLPLLVALVDLHSQRWYPVLDLAMTEFRVRDVGGGRIPLIGLPGRIAPGPEQGSHPGPLSFYLLAPVYRLLGSTSWALEAATVAVHVVAIAAALWIAHRRAGWRGVLAAGALLTVVIRGYGQVLLTQPWNPYLPLLVWIVVLLAAWAVACGDRWMLVPMVIAGSFCAQTHVPYLVPAGALTIGTIAVAVVRRPPRRRSSPARRQPDGPVLASVGLGLLLWVPPVIDQAINDPGNVGKLLDHFGSPPDDALGVAVGIRLALRHLDLWAGFAGQFADAGGFVSPSSAGRGAVVLAGWLVAVAVAARIGSPSLRALHAVIGAALLLGLLSMTRIFGLPWFYLTLWAWGTSAVALGAIVWTAVAAWRRLGGPGTRRFDRRAGRGAAAGGARVVVTGLSAAVLAFGGVMSTVSFADADIPEARLSDAVGALTAPTYRAIVDGVGASTGLDAIYQVRWSDAADIGSPGFGLLNALERRGIDVRADTYFHIPATEYRVGERTAAAAQIHLATGSYIGTWRRVPGAVEVATYEPRDAGEVVEFHRTRRRLVERLAAEGLDDVVAEVDTNLFGGSLDPRLSAADVDDFTVLLELGQPMSVFIAPATADPVL